LQWDIIPSALERHASRKVRENTSSAPLAGAFEAMGSREASQDACGPEYPPNQAGDRLSDEDIDIKDNALWLSIV
jgi:hypothetical protein